VPTPIEQAEPAGVSCTTRTPAAYVQRLAAYTANLILLRLAIAEEPVPIMNLCPAEVQAAEWWAASVRLWRAALSPSYMDILITLVDANCGHLRRSHRRIGRGDLDVHVDWLAQDTEGAFARAAGRGLLDREDQLRWFFARAPYPEASLNLAFELSQWLTSGSRDANKLRDFFSDFGDDLVRSPNSLMLARLVLFCMEYCGTDVDYELVKKLLLATNVLRQPLLMVRGGQVTRDSRRRSSPSTPNS
jgi:hypothetical protein